MLLWRHLEIEPEYEFQTARHKKKSYRLKPDGMERWLPVAAGYEEDVDFHSTDPDNLAKLQKYNDRDSVHTWIIGYLIWGLLTESQRQCALVEAASLSMVAEANYGGMLVDTLACRELGAYLEQVAAEMLEKLAPHGVTEKVVRSPKQLSELMFDRWKLPVLKENTSKKTGQTSRSTDKEVLHELAFADPRCADLKRYREALNNRAKFADGIIASAEYNGDGRTRPGAIVFGTYSGRLTYASKQGKGKDERPVGFALHQEKRDVLYRASIIPPPGYTLVEFDASGQEYRWMAIASGDETMLQLCLPGEDPHSFMGARIVGRDYQELMRAIAAAEEQLAKDSRQLGKVGNLSLQYRTSARKLRSVARVQYNIPMELPEAQRIHRTYQLTYPKVPKYWEEQIALTKARGYVETFAGRRVGVTGNWDGEWGWSMGSTSINYRIQGTGADQKYLAMKAIKAYVTSVGGRFAWDLHDGLYFYIPDDKVARTIVDIKKILDNLPYKEAWGFSPPVPLPWDCKIGKSWGALKEHKFE
jgi:DNA polymerase-1